MCCFYLPLEKMNEFQENLKQAVIFDCHDGPVQKCIEILEADPFRYKLEEADLECLKTLLSKKSVESALKLIANLAKNEGNRMVMTREDILKKIFSLIPQSNEGVFLQIIRCICNIAAENENVIEHIVKFNGMQPFFEKIKSLVEDTEKHSSVMLSACLCLQNVLAEADGVEDDFIKADYMLLLWAIVVKHEVEENIVEAAIVSMSLLSETLGICAWKASDVLSQILNYMKCGQATVKRIILDDLLMDIGKVEATQALLCQHGYIHGLVDLINVENESLEIQKLMLDLVVLLMSSECAFPSPDEDMVLLDKLVEWTQSTNRHMQVSGGLGLGNYARTEEACRVLIEKNIHSNLISVVDNGLEKVDFESQTEAFTSCLRNMCVPVAFKSVLFECGLGEVAVALIMERGLAVQFKALSILRLLAPNNVALVERVTANEGLLRRVCELCETTSVSSVPSEAQRLLAALLKNSPTNLNLHAMASSGCLRGLTLLSSSEHAQMQNEGLLALVMLVTKTPDCIEDVRKSECMEKTVKLLETPQTPLHILHNGLALIQACLSFGEDGRRLLEESRAIDVLCFLGNHADESVSKRAIETRDLVAKTT